MKTSLAMPTIRTPLRLTLLALLGSLCSLPPLHAAITISIEQVGSGVEISYSGSWDVWSRENFGDTTSDLAVYSAGIFNLPPGSDYDLIGGPGEGLTKASGLWTSVLTRPDSTAGDVLAWNSNFTYTPLNYTAGNPIVGSMTFNNTDLATMGFTPGDSGSWTGPAGTANFSVSAVPEPTSLALLFTGVAGCVTAAGIRRRRRLSLVMTALKAPLC